MFLDQRDEIMLRVSRQCRLAEVRIVREEVRGLAVQVRKIAAATARHQDLLSNLVGALKHDNAAATTGSRDCAHEARGASANNQDIGVDHAGRIAGACRFLRLVPGFTLCDVGVRVLSIGA